MKSRLPIEKKQIKKIVKKFIPQSSRAYAIRRLVEVLKEVEKLRINNGLVRDVQSGDLVRSVFMGEYWDDQGSQMRKRKRIFPQRPRGAVDKPYIKYLTIMLGEIYNRATLKIPVLAHLEQPHSEFEMFVGVFLKHYGISDCRRQLRQYIKSRKVLIK